jgi:hypothetical protein
MTGRRRQLIVIGRLAAPTGRVTELFLDLAAPGLVRG